MMNKNYPLNDLQSKIGANQKILIYLPVNPNFDQVAAALALSLSLQETGKTVSVICPTQITVEFNRLVGVDKIIGKTKGTDLVIGFNYPSDQIEKVSYNDEGGRPSVVIQPKVGGPQLTENSVTFSYAGSGAGLAITCGVKSLNQLPKVEQDILSSCEVINIDADQANEGFGLLKVVDLDASCVSEMSLGIILGLSLPFGRDIAQNLLSGIWQSTGGMVKTNVGPDTYEAIAICLRIGAQRPQEGVYSQQQTLKSKPKFEQRETRETKEEKKPVQSPANPPADWFEPKIFKGSSIA